MSRLRSVAGLCNRGASALAARSVAVVHGSAVQTAASATRNHAVLSAAAGAAAMGSTMTLRVMGYNVPYPFILGSALAVAGGVYYYELMATKHEKEAPLKAYTEAPPHIRTLSMKNHEGRTFTARDLAGKYAVLAFGTVHSDINLVPAMAKAAESVKQRSGTAIVPVFVTLDPTHDKPADLKHLVGSTGSMDMVALTGDADDLLCCANKFKKMELAVRKESTRDEETMKHDTGVDESYVSSYVFLVDPNGDFVSMMSKALPADKMANQICLSI